MKRKTAFPFLVFPDGVVQSGTWMLGASGTPLEPVSDILENWDYAKGLETKFNIEIDLDLAAKALGIPRPQLDLEAILKVGTGSGNMPRRVNILDTVKISHGNGTAELTGFIDSGSLSGRLRLECVILLGNPPIEPSQISPTRRGAKLWHTQKDILIEDGGASRFPMETISFSKSFAGLPHMNAPWFFEWRPNAWHMDFGGNVRLYVNSDIANHETRVAEGDPLTLQTILADIMNQMISVVAETPDSEELLSDCSEGTVGQQLRRWMDISFPGQSIAAIAALRSHRPGCFNAAILSAAEVGGES